MFDFLGTSRHSSPPTSLPGGWESFVERSVPLAQRLTREEYRTFSARMGVFLEQKRFEGCGGLELTDEMRVTIAAHACLLLVGLEGEVFPTVQTILVYPHAYKAVQHERLGPVTIEREQARAGEAWGARGPLVLAWDNVQRASVMSERNVVLHEFAHALDSENGDMDGAPVLPSRERAGRWAQVLGDEFAKLADAVREGRETDIDPYGATNPAEFFAVVTEAFFGTPELLAEKHPELYTELLAFYGLEGYPAGTSRARATAPRMVRRRLGLRQTSIFYLLLVATCILTVFLRFAGIEIFGHRRSGVVEGTVTGPPSEVARTGRARVLLDTGREVQVDGAVGDYPTGTRVTVQILKSPVLGRPSYVFTLPPTSGPTFDEEITRK
jgi:MtfA peptidase